MILTIQKFTATSLKESKVTAAPPWCVFMFFHPLIQKKTKYCVVAQLLPRYDALPFSYTHTRSIISTMKIEHMRRMVSGPYNREGIVTAPSCGVGSRFD